MDKLAAFIKSHRQELLAEWERERDGVGVSAAFAQHLPTLVDALARGLTRGTPPTDPGLRDGDLGELIREYGRLHEHIIQLWARERGNGVATDSACALVHTLTGAIARAAELHNRSRDRVLHSLSHIASDVCASEDDLVESAMHLLADTTTSVAAVGLHLLRDDQLVSRARRGISRTSPSLREAERAAVATAVAENRALLRCEVDRHCLYALPLRHDARALGAVCLVSAPGAVFSHSDQRLFEAVAGHVGAALYLRQTHADIDRRTAELGRCTDTLEHGDAVLVVDRHWRVVLVNKNLERLFRVPREHALGEVFWDAYSDAADTRARYWEEFHRVMEERDPVCFEDYYPSLDMWTDVTAYPSEEGGIAVFFRDVTDRKRAQRAYWQVEQRYRLMVEQVTDYALCLLDTEGRVISWNAGAARILGYSGEEIIGQDFAVFFPEGERASLPHRQLDMAARDGRAQHEGWWLGKGGRCLWADTTLTALHGLDGRISGYAKIVRDLSERKRREQGLRMLEKAARALAESLDQETTLHTLAELAVEHVADWCGVDLLEDDGQIVLKAIAHRDPRKAELARRLRRRFPLHIDSPHPTAVVVRTRTATLDRTLSAANHVDAAHDPEHLKALQALGLRSRIAVPLVARGRVLGALTLLSAESGREYDEQDLALARDLATNASLALDNVRLLQSARRAIRLREGILAVVSHDLRSPLAAITLGTQRLQRRLGATDPDHCLVLAGIQRSAEQMQRLIGDLLDMASVQAGRLALQPEVAPLAPVVSEAVDLCRTQAAARKLSIRATLKLDDVEAEFDRGRLEQVLGNLLGNAIKFSRDGGEIRVRGRVSGTWACIEVSDQGPGIAPADLPHIFEPYWSGVPHRHKGMGLGLFISKGIAEAHGGTLEARSRPGAGSSFRLRLPIVRKE